MTATITIAPVRKSIRVSASQAHAFEVFTSGLGRWWPRTASIGKGPMKMAIMEARLGGRWYELSEDGSQADVGKIIVWDPPRRFVVTWDINSNWKPDTAISSEVEVKFIADGPELDAGGIGTSQVRADGRRRGREDAQGRRWRLARHARSLQEGSRGVNR